MIEIRPFASLGRAEHGWLSARHHFAFGAYREAGRNGWGRIRVWNDDAIAPGTGFDPHPHRDMEIVTFVRQGAISHRDNLGNQGRTEAGDVQVMSAGRGITHAEYNLEPETTTLFQIWITPDQRGIAPSWGSRAFPREAGAGFVTLASGRDAEAGGGALPLNADAAVLAARLAAGEATTATIGAGRLGYLVVARGSVTLNGESLGERDAAAIEGAEVLALVAGGEGAELVLVETAPERLAAAA
ncbi:pirin-like bicupin family protein [Roseomonas sp. 18066]|uniref:pirin family protein n=1 Tax=Roseomonas sp. 18066 TaxID=2681412 RepID=UPI001356C16F|nr:pirin-like bicupin family protein [Roseomonas sp. 18066]